VKRWLREPLLRFLVGGLALRPNPDQHVERSRIEGTRGRPPPTACHLDGAVENANIPHFTT
jgi:hypothetical protein